MHLLPLRQNKLERKSSEEHKHKPQQKSEIYSFDKHIYGPNPKPNPHKEVAYGAKKLYFPQSNERNFNLANRPEQK